MAVVRGAQDGPQLREEEMRFGQTIANRAQAERRIRPAAITAGAPVAVVSAVCQMSIDLKCDRFGFGYPTPCTTVISPSSYNSRIPSICGCSPTSDFDNFSTLSAATPIDGERVLDQIVGSDR